MASVNECLIKIQELTQTNLDILKALNDSFFTNKNHLMVEVSGNQFAIPSFLSLENKINLLSANFENLIHAPKSGEAYFHVDGNSRAIEIKPYTYTPNSISLKPVTEFNVDQNDIFKDFLYPNTYINISLEELPNDINKVNVKKIIPINSDLKKVFEEYLKEEKVEVDENGEEITTIIHHTSKQYGYGNIYRLLANYVEDKDYVMYDTIYNLPLKNSEGYGNYVIEEIVEDYVDENLDNYVVVKLRSDMTDNNYFNTLQYAMFNETINRNIEVGDELVTFEGNAKMQVVEVKYNTNTLKLKVLFGDYINLVPSNTNVLSQISDLSKLRYFPQQYYSTNKYIKVPLKEDRLLFISIAAVNDRMGLQGNWGTGLILDIDRLVNGNATFKDYYNKNVRNVGDILYKMTSLLNSSINTFSNDEVSKYLSLTPNAYKYINCEVQKINSHLDNSPTVRNIRKLYDEKVELQTKLDQKQTDIDNLQNALSKLNGTEYINKEKELTTTLNEKNNIISKINEKLQQIANAANTSEVPIENGKYRIRGYFDYEKWIDESGLDARLKSHIMGIRVRYRYRNVNKTEGNTVSLNGGAFIFSEWNDMVSRDRIITNINGGYGLDEDTSKFNEPSFNQIDIPISQGEVVDVKVKVVFDFGWPFAYLTSQWSKERITYKFPDEFTQEVAILDILNDNTNEIELYKFKNVLIEDGVPTHINDQMQDQNILYMHRAENIASGFYTAERRVIPLKDKLTEMTNSINELYDEVIGGDDKALNITIINGSRSTTLHPFQNTGISVESFDNWYDVTANDAATYEMRTTSNESTTPKPTLSVNTLNNNYSYDKYLKLVTVVLNLCIKNTSNKPIKLYSIFPGSNSSIVNLKTKYDRDDYILNNKCVKVCYKNKGNTDIINQYGNQFLTFRVRDAYNGEEYYAEGDQSKTNLLSLDEVMCSLGYSNVESRAWMYPMLNSKNALAINENNGKYKTINPDSSIIVPIVFEYMVKDAVSPIHKTMSFDLRTSLYNDPTNYTFTVTAKYQNTAIDKVLSNNVIISDNIKFNTSIL